MKHMLKLLVLALGLGVITHAQAVTGNADAGKAKSATCAGCHGMDGNSASAANPKLAGQGAKYIVKQLEDFKSGKRANALMAGFASGLSEQDMADLGAYYAAQTPKGGATDAKYVETGQKLYRGGNVETGAAACAACHGANGQGIAEAGFPRIAGQHAGYTEAQLKAFRAAGRADIGAPAYRTNDAAAPEEPGMMRDIAKKLSDAEIQALSNYLQGLY